MWILRPLDTSGRWLGVQDVERFVGGWEGVSNSVVMASIDLHTPWGKKFSRAHFRNKAHMTCNSLILMIRMTLCMTATVASTTTTTATSIITTTTFAQPERKHEALQDEASSLFSNQPLDLEARDKVVIKGVRPACATKGCDSNKNYGMSQ